MQRCKRLESDADAGKIKPPNPFDLKREWETTVRGIAKRPERGRMRARVGHTLMLAMKAQKAIANPADSGSALEKVRC